MEEATSPAGDASVHASSAAAAGTLFARLDATHGFEVDLGPGEILFIPHHCEHTQHTPPPRPYPLQRNPSAAHPSAAHPSTAHLPERAGWHHVETTEGDGSVDGLSLSLNLWFDFQPRLVAPPLPLRAGLLLELARHVEGWLAMALGGAREVPAFLHHCVTELGAPFDAAAAAAADEANASTLPRPWLIARNLLFCELATAYLGWAGLRPFFDALLHPDRFAGLEPCEPEMVGGMGH